MNHQQSFNIVTHGRGAIKIIHLVDDIVMQFGKLTLGNFQGLFLYEHHTGENSTKLITLS